MQPEFRHVFVGVRACRRRFPLLGGVLFVLLLVVVVVVCVLGRLCLLHLLGRRPPWSFVLRAVSSVRRRQKHVHLPHGLVAAVVLVRSQHGALVGLQKAQVRGRLAEDRVANHAGRPVEFNAPCRPRLQDANVGGLVGRVSEGPITLQYLRWQRMVVDLVRKVQKIYQKGT